MSRWAGKLKALKNYADIVFFLRVFLFALRINVTPDKYLLPLVDCPCVQSGQDKEKILRYVNRCFIIRKKLGVKDRCLFSSILLCHFLRKYGYNAHLVFAVKKQDQKMQGHCWVEQSGDAGRVPQGWEVLFRYPAQKKAAQKIAVMDDHSQAYWVWKEKGIKNKILVHLDAHMDCNWIPQKDIHDIFAVQTLKELNALLNSPGRWDLSGKTRQERIGCGNFILPALQQGMVKEFYWVAPDYEWSPDKYGNELRKALSQYEGYPMGEIKVHEKSVTVNVNGCAVTCCRLCDLPLISSDVLLDIDLDYMIKGGESSQADIKKEPWVLPRELAQKIKEKGIKADIVTIACSVSDGFTPGEYSFFADSLAKDLREVVGG